MPRLLNRPGLTLAGALALSTLVWACGEESGDRFYLGTWDPVLLTHQGDVIAIDNGGISFRDNQVCFIRFSEECHDAGYTQLKDVVTVNMGGDPGRYLLYQPFEGYLLVREISDRPTLYIRREE